MLGISEPLWKKTKFKVIEIMRSWWSELEGEGLNHIRYIFDRCFMASTE